MTDRVGEKLGKYRLLRRLGHGGFAEVYVGEHVFLGSQAAIKILRTSLTAEETDNFQVEARRLASLIHPHIVRVLDFDVEKGMPFLVMEYAPNGSLRDSHPKGSLVHLDQILLYVKQIASALQFLHDQKLIHRDVKPENMLIGLDNKILLSDIGIAVPAHREHSLSVQNVVGTPTYMAPEQFLGKPRPASDQYSLSVIVYEWLCGSTPFLGDFIQLGHQHSSVPPPSLLEKILTLSPDIEEIIMKALSKEHAQRFPNIQDFANALELVCKPRQSVPIELLPKSQLLSRSLKILDTQTADSPEQALPLSGVSQKETSFDGSQYSGVQFGQILTYPAQNNAKGQLPIYAQNNLIGTPHVLQPLSSPDNIYGIPEKSQQSNVNIPYTIPQQNAYDVASPEIYEGNLPPILNEYAFNELDQSPQQKQVPKVGLIIGTIGLVIFLISGTFAGFIYFKNNTQNNTTTKVTPTIIATPTVVPLFSDSFTNNTMGWDLTSIAGKFSVNIVGSSLILEDNQNKLLWELLPSNKSFTDFRLDVNATLTKGDPNNGYGILIRAANQGSSLGTYYRFELYGDRTYAIFKGYVDATGTIQSKKVQGYTANAAIAKVGQVNHITIVAKGSVITMTVNGQAIATYTDDTYKGGQIALFVSNLPNLNAGAQATFKNLVVFPSPQ